MSVGLDIGSKTVKVVELSKEGEKYTLSGAGVVGYNGMDVSHIQDEKGMVELAALIRKLFSDAGIHSKDVAIALPESQVFTRAITFPLLTDQEIASAVKWEAEQYIPFPIAEAIVQHQIIEKRENTTPPGVLVLLVASPRALVEKYIKLLTMAGLNAVAVETELLSLCRAIAPTNQTAIIADFGASSTDIAITKNGLLTFSRSIPTGGEAFSRAVAQSLGVNQTQAEEYKKAYGFEPSKLEGKVGAALDPVFRIISEEIKKSISFYQAEEKGETPSSLILTGGTSGLPDATTKLTKAIGIEVSIGNPFSKISMDPATAKGLVAYAPLYPIAVGLALRSDV